MASAYSTQLLLLPGCWQRLTPTPAALTSPAACGPVNRLAPTLNVSALPCAMTTSNLLMYPLMSAPTDWPLSDSCSVVPGGGIVRLSEEPLCAGFHQRLIALYWLESACRRTTMAMA